MFLGLSPFLHRLDCHSKDQTELLRRTLGESSKSGRSTPSKHCGFTRCDFVAVRPLSLENLLNLLRWSVLFLLRPELFDSE